MRALLLIAAVLLSGSIAAQNYRVKAVSANGRDTSLSNTYKTKPGKPRQTTVWIPTVFTPNLDGLNDLFAPIVMEADSFHFEIFTREGQFLTSLKAGETWKGSGVSSSFIWLAKWKDTTGKWHKEAGVMHEVR